MNDFIKNLYSSMSDKPAEWEVMNNKSEARNRLAHAADELQKARDSLLLAQAALDCGRGYQAHRVAEEACKELAQALESIKFASLIGEVMANEKRHAGDCPQFKEAEIPNYLKRQAE